MLKDSLNIKGMKLSNRLVFPPMASGTADECNHVTAACIEQYSSRAGGDSVGLIIVEHEFISPEGKASARQLSIAGDGDIEGLSRLAEAVHSKGSAVVAQINHAGANTKREYTGLETVGVCKFPPYGRPVPDRELTKSDIERVIEAFAKAAQRAEKAGFDGVEIHSAHGYLLNQFYSPLTNSREDEYGGCIENRLRIHLETIAAVRSAVGRDFCVLLRLGASDYIPGGSTIADGVTAAELFKDAGLDCLDISGGFCSFTRLDLADTEGYFSDASAAIKEKVDIPLILTGGIKTGAAAEALLKSGKADLIGIGRPLFADADYVRKMLRNCS